MKICKEEIEKLGFKPDPDFNQQEAVIESYVFDLSHLSKDTEAYYEMAVYYKDAITDKHMDNPEISMNQWVRIGKGDDLEDYKVDIIFDRLLRFESMEQLITILRQVPYIFKYEKNNQFTVIPIFNSMELR